MVKKRDRVSPWWEKEIRGPIGSRLLSIPICNASGKRKTQCPVEGRVKMPMQQTPHGWPETEVLALHEIPRKIWPWMLNDSGLLRSKSLKRSDAMVAMRKQPNVITSSNKDCWDRIFTSQAAKTASGMGVASEPSNGMRVWDLRKSETVWLCRAVCKGRSSLRAIQCNALMCVSIRVLDGLESFRLLRWSEAWR